MKFSKDYKFYEIKLSSIKIKRAESMEAAEKYKKRKTTTTKRTLYDYVERHEKAYRHIKLKVWLILMKSIQVPLNH